MTERRMLTVPALKVQQFGQEFFLVNLAATDVDRLVRFEVLGDSVLEGRKGVRRGKKASPVNWGEIESRVQASEEAYQRPILRKKIDELVGYYLTCRDDGGVPAIPGAVLLTTDQPVHFVPQGNPFVGLLHLGDEGGTLRVLDGQHRLLALAALLGAPDIPEAERASARLLQVPALLFAQMPPPSIVEMFVTINSKHTRLNSSLLFDLKGRQLYADPLDARVHDVVKRLNEAESSPLKGRIKMLGVGPGDVAQAGLAQELRRVLTALRTPEPPPWYEDFVEHAERFYLLYFKEVAHVFEAAWGSKRHSLRSLIALRAFVQASQEVAPRVWAAGGDPREAARVLLAPWATQPGAARFETAGAWRERAAGGGKETTRLLARELVASLGGRA